MREIYLPTHLVTISSAFHFFVLIQISIWYHLLSAWRTSFNISLWWSSSGNKFFQAFEYLKKIYFVFIFKRYFCCVKYSGLTGVFFFFSFRTLPTWIVTYKKSAIILIFDSLYILCLFFFFFPWLLLGFLFITSCKQFSYDFFGVISLMFIVIWDWLSFLDL